MGMFEPRKAVIAAIRHSPYGLANKQYIREKIGISTERVIAIIKSLIGSGVVTEDSIGSMKVVRLK